MTEKSVRIATGAAALLFVTLFIFVVGPEIRFYNTFGFLSHPYAPLKQVLIKEHRNVLSYACTAAETREQEFKLKSGPTPPEPGSEIARRLSSLAAQTNTFCVPYTEAVLISKARGYE